MWNVIEETSGYGTPKFESLFSKHVSWAKNRFMDKRVGGEAVLVERMQLWSIWRLLVSVASS